MNKNALIATLALLLIGAGGYIAFYMTDSKSAVKNEKVQKTALKSEEAPFRPVDVPPENLDELLLANISDAGDVIPDEEKPEEEEDVEIEELECGEWECYEKHYQKLVSEQSVDAAFADLKKRYYEDSYVRGDCHQMTHVIGRAATAKYPSVSEAYIRGDYFCWSGYYHGIMEGILSKLTPEEVVVKLNDFCQDIPGKEAYSFDYYNCVHGMGHGLMFITAHEIFESLEKCDLFTGNWERQSCYGGVFMENVIADGKNHITKYLKTDDPVYPCNAVDEKYKNQCYLMQTSYMLRVLDYDFKKVFDLCEQADEAYIDTCYTSLGRDASGLTTSDVARTRELCLVGKDFRQRSNCIIGAAKDFISYHHSDTQAKLLCETLPDQELQDLCLSTVKSFYTAF